MAKEYLRTWEVSWFEKYNPENPTSTWNVKTKNKTIHFYHSSGIKEVDKIEIDEYAKEKFNLHTDKFLFIKEI
tara:strand:+ start:121 stop:339 length:219 start_codon:yes stop_codon:yes gene_type:complete